MSFPLDSPGYPCTSGDDVKDWNELYNFSFDVNRRSSRQSMNAPSILQGSIFFSFSEKSDGHAQKLLILKRVSTPFASPLFHCRTSRFFKNARREK